MRIHPCVLSINRRRFYTSMRIIRTYQSSIRTRKLSVQIQERTLCLAVRLICIVIITIFIDESFHAAAIISFTNNSTQQATISNQNATEGKVSVPMISIVNGSGSSGSTTVSVINSKLHDIMVCHVFAYFLY